MLEALTTLRRHLHKHPELSGNEENTAKKIIEFIEPHSPSSLLTNVGGYGIVATWDSSHNGPHIMYRADFDALPIQETNEFSHKSIIENISHKCGHDGHTAILCGVAQLLSEKRLSSGKITLLFQPAEETGAGARAMLADKRMDDYKFDFVFALHNLPGFPLHEIIAKENSFTPAVISLVIELVGAPAHAAEPEKGTNPSLAIAGILQNVLALQNNDATTDELFVITPVYINAGEKAYGVSAGKGEIHFTMRCWQQKMLEENKRKVEEISSKIAEMENLEINFQYVESFAANENNSAAVNLVRKAAIEKNLSLTELEFGMKWGEDFGLFTQKFEGVIFGIGSGENCKALHNDDYDFPDEIIETAIKMFQGIAEELGIIKKI